MHLRFFTSIHYKLLATSNLVSSLGRKVIQVEQLLNEPVSLNTSYRSPFAQQMLTYTKRRKLGEKMMMSQHVDRQEKLQKDARHAQKGKPNNPARASSFDGLTTKNRENGKHAPKSLQRPPLQQQHPLYESPAVEKYDPNDPGTLLENSADGGVLANLPKKAHANLNNLSPITEGERVSHVSKRRKPHHGQTNNLNFRQNGFSSLLRRRTHQFPARRSPSGEGQGKNAAEILNRLGKTDGQQSKKSTVRQQHKGWTKSIEVVNDLTAQRDDGDDQRRVCPSKKRKREEADALSESQNGKVSIGFGRDISSTRKSKLAQDGRPGYVTHIEQRSTNYGMAKRHQHHQISQEKEAPGNEKPSVCDAILSDDDIAESIGSNGTEPSTHSSLGTQDLMTKSLRGPRRDYYYRDDDPINDLDKGGEGGGDEVQKAFALGIKTKGRTKDDPTSRRTFDEPTRSAQASAANNKHGDKSHIAASFENPFERLKRKDSKKPIIVAEELTLQVQTVRAKNLNSRQPEVAKMSQCTQGTNGEGGSVPRILLSRAKRNQTSKCKSGNLCGGGASQFLCISSCFATSSQASRRNETGHTRKRATNPREAYHSGTIPRPGHAST
jgi:hypothetical protein